MPHPSGPGGQGPRSNAKVLRQGPERREYPFSWASFPGDVVQPITSWLPPGRGQRGPRGRGADDHRYKWYQRAVLQEHKRGTTAGAETEASTGHQQRVASREQGEEVRWTEGEKRKGPRDRFQGS